MPLNLRLASSIASEAGLWWFSFEIPISNRVSCSSENETISFRFCSSPHRLFLHCADLRLLNYSD
jgi:hypothetical protein